MLIQQTRPKHRTRFPVVCLAIAAVCLGVVLWQMGLDEAAGNALLKRWGTVPSVLFGAESHPGGALQTLLTLFTALFIHADWPHLLGNLVYLLLFGIAVERAIGRVRFALLYLVCGGLASFMAAWQLGEVSQTPVIGASGAVSAIIGAYLTLFPRASMVILLPLGVFIQFVRVPVLVVIGSWFTLQVLYTWIGPAFGMIAWWAHVTGFLGGVMFTLPAGPGTGDMRLRRG